MTLQEVNGLGQMKQFRTNVIMRHGEFGLLLQHTGPLNSAIIDQVRLQQIVKGYFDNFGGSTH
jgi:hypothetical protein